MRKLRKKYKFKNKANIYMFQIYKNIIPLVSCTPIIRKGSKIFLPKLNKLNRKNVNTISCLWLKKTINLRKEKTLFLKIVSELEGVRKGLSASIVLKNLYYINFFKNKFFIKFFKKRNWI